MSMAMTRRHWLLFFFAAVGVGWFLVTDARNKAIEGRAYAVVKKLGGEIGSLTPPFNFFGGKEYVFTFENTRFSDDELQQFRDVLISLREGNDVVIILRDTNLSHDDIVKLHKQLPKKKCRFTRIHNHETEYVGWYTLK